MTNLRGELLTKIVQVGEAGYKASDLFRLGYIKHFTINEPNVEGLDPYLILMLDYTRRVATQMAISAGYNESLVAMRITCGLQPDDPNDDSTHECGLGADIGCNNSPKRAFLLAAAQEVGIRRIGIYNLHLHFDIGDWFFPTTYAPNVDWHGISS